MVEVSYYPDATVISVWPFDTPKEREQWLERFKEVTTDFIIAADRDIAEYEKKKSKNLREAMSYGPQ